ncbi:MAG TPA: transporter [Thermoanaerobaculia bacterium]|nr:transporter [Thermoanaerobaculia bacterium]
MRRERGACALLMLGVLLGAWRGDAQTANEAAELAKKLSNPVANLISVPLQSNWDYGLGTTNATKYVLNIQPVIPITLTERWNLITRTIVPYVSFGALSPVESGAGGLGDTVQSFFLSPKEPTGGGWILGAGPVLLYPTATSRSTGSGKWGAGPTVVLLKQEHGWTYGVLANHLWSFAGPENRASVNSTFLQPFLSFTTATYTTIGFNTESTYDWTNDAWTVPLNLTAAQLVKVGGKPVSFTLGGRYYATTPSGGPDWGLRFVVTLLFPK